MTYVKNADLTPEYLNSLIGRAGFTNVTSAYYDDPSLINVFWVIRDLNGNDTFYGSNISAVRDAMITQYLIQQNS